MQSCNAFPTLRSYNTLVKRRCSARPSAACARYRYAVPSLYQDIFVLAPDSRRFTTFSPPTPRQTGTPAAPSASVIVMPSPGVSPPTVSAIRRTAQLCLCRWTPSHVPGRNIGFSDGLSPKLNECLAPTRLINIPGIDQTNPHGVTGGWDDRAHRAS